jgi:hypothetical protein
MTREDILRMADEAYELAKKDLFNGDYLTTGFLAIRDIHFHRLATAAEREKVAKWMIEKGYATGHGDTVEDLLKELEWQIAERMKSEGWRQCAAGQRTTQYCDLLELAVANEREAILKLTDSLGWIDSAAIRARGNE